MKKLLLALLFLPLSLHPLNIYNGTGEKLIFSLETQRENPVIMTFVDEYIKRDREYDDPLEDYIETETIKIPLIEDIHVQLFRLKVFYTIDPHVLLWRKSIAGHYVLSLVQYSTVIPCALEIWRIPFFLGDYTAIFIYKNETEGDCVCRYRVEVS